MLLKKSIQRCIASLLTACIIGGAFSPTYIYAKLTADVTKETGAKSSSYKDVDKALKTQASARYIKYILPNKDSDYKVTGVGANGQTSVTKFAYIRLQTKGKNNPSFLMPYIPLDWVTDHSSAANASPLFANDPIYVQYHNFTDLLKIGDDTSDEDYTDKILSPLDSSLGTGISKFSEMTEKLATIDGSQGASTKSLANLNQRMAAILYAHLTSGRKDGPFLKDDNGAVKVKWKDTSAIDDANYKSLLSATLSDGYKDGLKGALVKLKIIKADKDLNDDAIKQLGKIYCPNYVSSLDVLGVLAIDYSGQVVRGNTGTAPDWGIRGLYSHLIYSKDTDLDEEQLPADSGVFYSNELAAIEMLSEYAMWAVKELPTFESTKAQKQDAEIKSTLTYLRVFHDLYSPYIPIIDDIYKQKVSCDDGQDRSIEDLVDANDADSMSLKDAWDVDTTSYKPHQDSDSPINQFYTINGKSGLASYDRDKVLGDVDVDFKEAKKTENEIKEKRAQDRIEQKDTGYLDNISMEEQKEYAAELLDFTEEILAYLDTGLNGDLFASGSFADIIKDANKEDFRSMDNLDDKLQKVAELNHRVSESDDAMKALYTYYESDKNKFRTHLEAGKYDTLFSVYMDQVTNGEGESLIAEMQDIRDKFENHMKDKVTTYMQDLFLALTDSQVSTNLRKVCAEDYSTLEKELNKMSSDSVDELGDIVNNVSNSGIDDSGKASSYSAVTINEMIVEGMGYSATYIPMRTNIYTEEIAKTYKGGENDNSKFYDFFVHYGYMRKALRIDTSSTAVMDYYNAGGVSTGSTRVATLRDLVESGSDDVALYIDSNFYNAKDACSAGNKIREGNIERWTNFLNMAVDYGQTKNADLVNNADLFVKLLRNPSVQNLVITAVEGITAKTAGKIKQDELLKAIEEKCRKQYRVDLAHYTDVKSIINDTSEILASLEDSKKYSLSDLTLKTNGNTGYDANLRKTIELHNNSGYRNLANAKGTNHFEIDTADESAYTDDNKDGFVLSSAQINEYMTGQVTYSKSIKDDQGKEIAKNVYSEDQSYSPLFSLAFVSTLYRSAKYFTAAQAVENNNPVFLASDEMTTVTKANQWYRNSLLNYALMKNLKANAQVDVSYVMDLDEPLYMDIFGNILTESGTVVIPAACNATLHTGNFKNCNFAVGLYSCYGKDYSVPIDLEGATTVLKPFFKDDLESEKWVINGITMKMGNHSVRYDKVDTYSESVQEAIRAAYKSQMSTKEATRYNWMAMVKIINEVMRGAPIEYINKVDEGIDVKGGMSGLIASAKLESMLDSLHGHMANTLVSIPDFTRMENVDVWIAMALKILIALSCAVVIIAIYRDAVSGQLSVRTAGKSLAAIALTVSVIVVIPAVFNLTYYTANKVLLEDEAFKILMVNEEKRQGGADVGITKNNSITTNGEFALQLDWVDVPWYRQLENVVYGSSLDEVQKVRKEAYESSAIYSNSDVTMYNDGAYITTEDLFDSIAIDFSFDKKGTERGMYFNKSKGEQTASFYSPYYAFLYALVADVNEFNMWQNSSGDNYSSTDEFVQDVEMGEKEIASSFNYTKKLQSGNRLKTVGLCSAYFTSPNFMENSQDIMRLYQIYGLTSKEYGLIKDYNDTVYNATSASECTKAANELFKGFEAEGSWSDLPYQANPALESVYLRDNGMHRSLVYSDANIKNMRSSYWFNTNLIDMNWDQYNSYLTKNGNLQKPERLFQDSTEKKELQKARNAYIEEKLTQFYKKVEAMDNYAREFIADNKDMLSKVSDETFLKCMALYLAVKYNQVFGVNSANSLEIFNMDSEDLIRLCIVPSDEAVMATSMSYPRFVYSFGGEAGVYMAAVLSVIMWIGSFIKPLCTIIVFFSVFLSIFVFRVLLRKPSANLWGYFITVCYLCATNLIHALILKIGVNLPSFGLSPTGCLIFMIVGQVAYLLLLGYVTGVSLKDWSNLGASEYEREARLLSRKLSRDSNDSLLDGRVKHHDDNWDYYNDLVDQHRSRNTG